MKRSARQPVVSGTMRHHVHPTNAAQAVRRGLMHSDLMPWCGTGGVSSGGLSATAATMPGGADAELLGGHQVDGRVRLLLRDHVLSEGRPQQAQVARITAL